MSTDHRLVLPVLAAAWLAACDSGGDFVPAGPGAAGRHGRGGAGGVAIATGGFGPGGRGGAVSTGVSGSIGSWDGGAGDAAGAAGGSVIAGRGGAGGAGGFVVGGRGGAGGRGGSGGGLCGPPSSTPPACPASLCGNGRLDGCVVSWNYYGNCITTSTRESCEGTDLAGETCATVSGFSQGQLRCAVDCTFDSSGCHECSDDAAVLRCGVTFPIESPMAYALAANDSEVAIASVSYDGQNPPALWLTRFSPELDPIDTFGVDEAGVARADVYGVFLALAPLPSGWAIVGRSYRGDMFVHTVGSDGQDIARTALSQPGWGALSVISRPDGGPLLAWTAPASAVPYYYSDVHAYVAAVSADGRSVTPPVEVPLGPGVFNELGRGAYFAGQFYLPFSMTSGTYASDPTLTVARVSTGGKLLGTVAAAPGMAVWTPRLVAGGDQLRMTYFGLPQGVYYTSNGTLLWQALDETGSAISYPVAMESMSGSLGPAVGLGDDTIQLVDEGYNDQAMLRVGRDGRLQARHDLMPNISSLGLNWEDAVTRGPDVIVAWEGITGQLRLIRTRP